MKRTPLKRKTPLKAKSGFVNKTPLKNSSKKKTTSDFNLKKEPSKKVKSRQGLQGAGRSEADIEFHSRVIELGCFACNTLRLTPISRLCLHHTDGRNNGSIGDYSERKTICLCNLHHDPSTVCGASTKGISVHHNKKAFVSAIGTEEWCVMETYRLLDEIPPWLEEADWRNYLGLETQLQQEEWLSQTISRRY